MPFLMALNWKWIAAAALVAVLIGTHIRAWQAGSAYTQARWDAAIAEQTKATLKLVQDAQEKERSLQEAAEKLRKAKNAEINDLATKLADALDSLRNRPSRNETSVPTDTTVGRGCYPSELYREDAAAFIKLAGEADQLRASLTYCQAQYSKARNQLTKGEKP
jgi:DNA repair exonuclease SbcCD ATPase subunit